MALERHTQKGCGVCECAGTHVRSLGVSPFLPCSSCSSHTETGNTNPPPIKARRQWPCPIHRREGAGLQSLMQPSTDSTGCNVAVLIHSRATCISAARTPSPPSRPSTDQRTHSTRTPRHCPGVCSGFAAPRANEKDEGHCKSKCQRHRGSPPSALEPCHLSACTPMPLPPALPRREQ